MLRKLYIGNEKHGISEEIIEANMAPEAQVLQP